MPGKGSPKQQPHTIRFVKPRQAVSKQAPGATSVLDKSDQCRLPEIWKKVSDIRSDKPEILSDRHENCQTDIFFYATSFLY